MDQMGEVNYAPGEPKGTSRHPARGFETVTIIDGTFRHQDSNGGGMITNGDTQWMTMAAGSCTSRNHLRTWVMSGGCSTASSSG
jgi:redox-sensitive bicupin YhaK (pirin superfamily)